MKTKMKIVGLILAIIAIFSQSVNAQIYPLKKSIEKKASVIFFNTTYTTYPKINRNFLTDNQTSEIEQSHLIYTFYPYFVIPENISSASSSSSSTNTTNTDLPALNLPWPVSFSNPQNLFSDGFGPRLKTSDSGRYDFHRGIDIPGTESDEIIAIADGEVYRVYLDGDPSSSYPDSGNVVIIKHNLDDSFIFHEEEINYYYSLYMHLSSISVAAGDAVSTGDTVGYIGHTGDTDFDHLHFEIRVGTTCSLEYSLSGSCGSGHNYDPHINPLTFLNYTQINTATVAETVSGDDLQLAVSLPRNEVDFNSIELITYDSSGNIVAEKNLDLNMREGLDATSETGLDTQTYDNIYLDPEEFSDDVSTWDLNVTFIDSLTSSVARYSYQVKDVFDNTLYFN